MDYIITDKEIIIKSGIFKKKSTYIQYHEIYNIFITDNIFDKISGRKSGTVFIYVSLTNKLFNEFGGNFKLLSSTNSQTIRGYYMLRSVKEALEVKNILDDMLKKNNINKVNTEAEFSARLAKENKV